MADEPDNAFDELRDFIEWMRMEAGAARLRIPFVDKHTPTCWTMHPACALKRVLDLMNGELADGSDTELELD